MKEAIAYIRQAIINRLTNNILIDGSPLPVLNRITSNTQIPYIRVYSNGTNETDFNQTSFITETITRIEVVTRYQGDSGGELQTNQAVNDILQLIRTRSAGYFDLSGDGFSVFTCINEGTNYFVDEDKDYTYYRAIIEISNKIQQLN
jgi:hypothetical protein